MARPALSYRAARRNKARKLHQIWRNLDHINMGAGQIYVPPLRTREEQTEAERGIPG